MATDSQDWNALLLKKTSELVQTLQDAAPKVTEALIKYIWAEGVTKLIISIILAAIAIFCTFSGFDNLKKYQNFNRYSDSDGLALSFFFVAVISLMFSANIFVESFPQVLAPEGAAIYRLLGN